MAKNSRKKELLSWMKAFAIALIIALFVKIFLLGNFVVDGASMNPTLENGDRLFVNKLTNHAFPLHHGDIIIFHATKTEDYVKRVIGLPGDTITYKDDQLYRNGKKINEPYLVSEKRNLGSGQLTEDFTLKDYTGKTKVPKDELWVMGDNRRISLDSRRLGFIKYNQVIGKVDLRYSPNFSWLGDSTSK
ncbi:signal peptidase I [Bacillus ginsengihumi]|uniref:Signal peptidase I n=1 Tax=Heyndrickxia ginsengihumi TaxID=363870 RepID=A0A6M0P9L7_9BACI|nr:signal peptidase I [Heyndrickxia ginsengihumi]NEY21454.1 signal peptidase I [Heyndrickxia ginsengihumi]